jgi:hypothetical protein
MDTLSAVAMNKASRGSRVRVFDWDKAAGIIANGRVTEAAAGLQDDWEWTGGAILRECQPVPADDTYTYLASNWAIPELRLESTPDGDITLPCWLWADETGWDAHTYWPDSALAILNDCEPKAIES